VKVWAVANQKGGVGKTTTAVTLAGVLASRGRDTLLVDLDPHGSLTAYFGHDPDTIEASGYLLFQGPPGAPAAAVERLLCRTATEQLYVLPASTAMATLDRQLGTREGMGLVIARALAPLAGRFEHVLLDCPPTLGVLMVNALGACQRLIIPVQTEYLAVKGLERMLHTLAMINRARKEPLPYTIVPTMFDRRTRVSTDVVRQLREQHDAHLWDSVIPVDTQLREASRAGRPLAANWARSMPAYSALCDYLLGLETPAAMPAARIA
jgi:chromosome partitioning protein